MPHSDPTSTMIMYGLNSERSMFSSWFPFPLASSFLLFLALTSDSGVNAGPIPHHPPPSMNELILQSPNNNQNFPISGIPSHHHHPPGSKDPISLETTTFLDKIRTGGFQEEAGTAGAGGEKIHIRHARATTEGEFGKHEPNLNNNSNDEGFGSLEDENMDGGEEVDGSILGSSQQVKGFPPKASAREILKYFTPLHTSTMDGSFGGGEFSSVLVGMDRARPDPMTMTPSPNTKQWYLENHLSTKGYYPRTGRATSNFIRFGRGGSNGPYGVGILNPIGFPGGTYNNNKKNNFIRLGRENPRQNSFIRLGRSGVPYGSMGSGSGSKFRSLAMAPGYGSKVGFFPEVHGQQQPSQAPQSLPSSYWGFVLGDPSDLGSEWNSNGEDVPGAHFTGSSSPTTRFG